MELNQAKAFFEQLETIDTEMGSKSDMIAVLRDRAERMTSSLSQARVQGGGEKRAMAEAVDMITDLEKEIDEERQDLCLLLKAAIEAIRTVSDPEQRTMLEQRYICGKSINQIAKEMHVSVRTAYRIHDDAMMAVIIPESA